MYLEEPKRSKSAEKILTVVGIFLALNFFRCGKILLDTFSLADEKIKQSAGIFEIDKLNTNQFVLSLGLLLVYLLFIVVQKFANRDERNGRKGRTLTL